MGQIVMHNGVPQEFPDEATPEMIAQALGVKPPQAAAPTQPVAVPQEPAADPYAVDPNRSVVAGVRDLAGGAAGKLQQLASLLGEGGQFLGEQVEKIPGFSDLQKYVQEKTGVSVPRVNIREEMGLEGDNQVDLGKLVASEKPDPIAYGVGSALPSVLAGGLSLPGQVAAGVASGVAGLKPGEENLGGLLPPGRGYGAAEEAAIGGLLAVAPGAIKGVMPKRAIGNFMKKIGGGAAEVPTAEANVANIENSVKQAKQARMDDALQHKTPIIEEHGDSKMLQSKPGRYMEQNSKAHGEYFGGLEEAHADFVKNKTLANADKLKSAIGKRIGKLNARKVSNAGLDRSEEKELIGLKKAYKDMKTDIYDHLGDISGKAKRNYQLFEAKWKNNVVPYDEANTSLRNIVKDKPMNTKPTNIRSAFSFGGNNPHVSKVLADLPQETKDAMIFNELITGAPKSPEKFLQSLEELSRGKGYDNIISPEMRQFMSKLRRQILAKKIAIGAGGLVGGGTALEFGAPPLIKHYLSK